MDNGFCCRFTGFYGDLIVSRRVGSWDLLQRLKEVDSLPWVCGGDFNEILSVNDKAGGSTKLFKGLNQFRQAIEDCNLTDLGFWGPRYTWNNKRPGDANTKLRLDKDVATKEWRDKFQLSSVTHLPPHESNHLPIILQTEHMKSRKGRKGFKFEENWLLWEDCEEVMSEA